MPTSGNRGEYDPRKPGAGAGNDRKLNKKPKVKPKFKYVEPPPVFLSEETWENLFKILGWDDKEPDAEGIQNEVEGVLAYHSVAAALVWVRPGQARAEMRRVLEAARALDTSLEAASMDSYFAWTEDFRIGLGDFITWCESALRSVPTDRSRYRPRRFSLQYTVRHLNKAFERCYRPRPGQRRAQNRDKFILTALASAGIPRIPESGRQLRRYLK
jgi:hypothetical protein